MAEITGMTAAAMQAIADSLIVDANIVGNDLVFTREDGTTLNAGSIVGLGVTGLLEWPNTNLGEITSGPEGVTTAKPGSMRFKTNGEVWIKLTGTGNTGWAKIPTVAPTHMLHIVCTSGTRPSSPGVGQTIYETDTGKELMYYGATTGWKPKWFHKWGSPTIMSVGAAIGTTGTTLTLMSGGPSFTPELAHRKIRITMSATYAQTGDGIFDFYIKLGSTGGTTLDNQRVSSINGAQSFISMEVFHDVTSTSTITPVWCAQRIAGSAGVVGALADVPVKWSVEDWGPATASSPPAV